MDKKKTLVVCLCAALAVGTVAGTVAIAKGCKEKESDKQSTQSVAFNGSYWATAGENECVFVLQNNAFTWTVGTEAPKTGTYTYDGKTSLKVKFAGGTVVTAKVEDGVITLTYDGVRYEFYKNEAYTVTLSSGGTVSVTNGKQMERPAEPTMAGKKFVGWYKDSAYKIPYNFADKVTGAFTLYARFETPSAVEYKAELVVDGQTTYTVETVGGVVYGAGLPTPVKEGAIFVGWWVSDYEDAEKLTAKCEELKIEEPVKLYAVWQSETPLVSVNSKGFSWTSNKTGQVSIKITPPAGDPVERTVPGKSYDYDFTTRAAGDYVIEVTIGGVTGKAYYQNKGLAKVNGFKYDGTVLTWNKVTGAEKYLVSVECGDSGHTHVDEEVTTEAYDFSNCAMKAGGIHFTVKAVANGYVSSVSDPFTVVKDLGAVENLAYDAATAKFTWTAVADATGYTVNVNGTNYTVTDAFFDAKEFGVGELTVSVTPTAFGFNSPAATTVTATKANIAAPTGMKLVASTLTWNAVAGATGYTVTVDGKEFSATTESFDISTADNVAADAKSCTITVTALGATAEENSLPSSVVTISFGEMADTLVYQEGKVTWDAVMNAQKYEVRLNEGEPTEVAADKTSANIAFTQDGVNVIEVRCYNQAGEPSEWVKVNVDVYEITFDYDVSLGSSDPVYKAAGDKFTLPANPTATGYKFQGWFNADKNGAQFTDATVTFNPENGDVVYAQFKANTYKLTYILNDFEMEQEVTYDSPFSLPVPKATDEDSFFGGWWTEANGQGIQYTNENGASIGVWKGTDNNVVLHACTVNLYEYVEVTSVTTGKKGYSVKAGADIGKVTEIKIPAMYNGAPVIGIESMGFANCAHLTKLSMPDTMETIFFGLDGPHYGTGSALYKCSLLEKIEVYAVEGNHQRFYESAETGELIHNNAITGEKELVFVPYAWQLEEYKIPEGVTTIATNLFRNYGGLKKIIIPTSVTKVNSGAFYSCKVQELVFEEGGTAPISFGQGAFKYCDFKTIKLPARMEKYQSETSTNISELFFYCDELVSIEVEEGNETYSAREGFLYDVTGDTLLYAPRAIQGEIVIPANTKAIAPESFYFYNASTNDYCHWITKVTIPASVTEIGAAAFKANESLKEVVFEGKKGDALINIGQEAFYNAKISTLTLPENTGKVSARAFGSMKMLSVVTINAGDGFEVEEGAFGDTSNNYYVTKAVLGKDVPIFNVNGAFGPTRLAYIELDPENEKMTLDEGVLFDKAITQIVYYPATKTGNYTIPDTIKIIGGNVFNGKSVEKVTIPYTVTEIGDGAFANCARLVEIEFASLPTDKTNEGLAVGARAFQNTPKLATIALPAYTKTIGALAFSSCGVVGTFNVPEGVTSLGDAAFKSATEVEVINLPSTLTQIDLGTDATNGKPSATYPEYYRTFIGCTSLGAINVADQNTVFASEAGLLYKLTDGRKTDIIACPANYAANDGKAVINGQVRKIWAYAFSSTVGLEEVSFATPDLTEAETEAGGKITIDMQRSVFENSTGLKKVVLGAGVEKLDNYAFKGCSELAYIWIPNTVHTITYGSVFSQCYKLSDIIFEEGNLSNKLIVTGSKSPDYAYTGSSAFYKLTALKSIRFPERTEEIGNMSFVDCSALEYIYIPSTVKTVGNFLFGSGSNKVYSMGCPLLKTVEFGETPEGQEEVPLTIGKRTFMGLNLENFKLPARTVEIKEYAFAASTISGEVVIPKAVKKIENYAFQYCMNVTSFTFEEGSELESIGNYAFASCNFESFEIPAGVKTVGQYAFAYTEKAKQITFATVDGVSALQKIDNYAFRQSGITSLTIPESSNDITLGTDLFQYCPSLKSVDVSSRVISAVDTFGHCGALETVTVDSENKNFKIEGASLYNKDGTAIQYLFAEATTEEGVYRIPDGITEIGQGAFRGQVGIKKLIIPASVKKIGKWAFRYCVNLEEIEFATTDSQLTEIGEASFEGCTSLTSITLPDTVETLAKYAFASCSNLQDIEMKGVKTLKGYTFYNCPSLKEVDISSVTSASSYDFAYSGLESVTIPAGLNNGTYMFYQCKSLSDVTVSEGVTAIGNYAFRGCTALEEIYIPSTVTKFGSYLFAESGLKSFKFTNPTATVGTYLFYNCTELRSVELIEGMTTLNAYMFYGCSNLGADAEEGKPSVKLPKSLTAVHQYVFAGCTSLKVMEFAPGIVDFGASSKWSTTTTSYLFQGCSSLEKVVLPLTLERIATGAFQDCVGLKTVENLDGVKVLYSSVFRNTGLESISLPSVTEFKGYVLADNPYLTEVHLNEQLASIDYNAFQNCTALEAIELPEGLTTLGSLSSGGNGNVFQGCTALKSITIPQGISELKKYMFEGCTELEEVNFLGAVSVIDPYAFANCPKLTNFAWTDFLITIGNHAFENSGLTRVEIPAATTSIGDMAFGNCANLNELIVSADNPYYTAVDGMIYDKDTGALLAALANYKAENGKLVISDAIDWKVVENASPFAGNTQITEIEITAAWEEVPYGLFYGMKNLTKVTLPATIKLIDSYAFQDCPNLATINLPDSIQEIGAYAFYGCAAMTEVTLPADLEVIGESAFEGTNLTSITMPSKVKEIQRYAFYGIESLATISLNEGLELVGGNAFAGSAITEVTIPASVKKFGSSVSISDNSGSTNTISSSQTRSFVFADCKNLVTATFLGSAVELTGYTFSGCTSLTTVNLPNGLLMIEDYMFFGCAALKSVDIPDTVKTIGGYAFANSGIESIEIPAGVECIGTKTLMTDPYQTGSTTGQSNGAYYQYAYPNGHVFMGCTSLTSVTFKGDLKQIGWYAFQGCTALETITIPNSVQIIGDYAFEGCSELKTLNVPTGIRFIGNYAFANTAITSVVVPSKVIVYNNAFAGWTAEQTLNVALDEYKAWSIWNLQWKNGCNATVVFGYEPATEE